MYFTCFILFFSFFYRPKTISAQIALFSSILQHLAVVIVAVVVVVVVAGSRAHTNKLSTFTFYFDIKKLK